MIFSHGVFKKPTTVEYNSVIDQSAMFSVASGTSLKRTHGTVTTVDGDIATFSFWVKRGRLGITTVMMGGKNDGDNKAYIGFDTSNRFMINHKRNEIWQCIMITTRTFTDCANWYHIHYIYDSDQGTASDRIVLTINGHDYDAADSALWATYTLPGSSEACRMLESGQNHWVSTYADATTAYHDGYMAHVYGIEGVAIPATEFGEFSNGIWIPKDYTVGDNSEGELSYKLDFSNSSLFGEDQSTNGNDFTDNNFGTDHQVPDTPEKNYCTFDYNNAHPSATLSEGNLGYAYAGSTWVNSAASFLMKTGKWYWEVDIGSDTAYIIAGITPQGERSGDFVNSGGYYPGFDAVGYGIRADGTDYGIWNNSGEVAADDNLDGATAGDIMTVAFDADAGKIWFGLYNAGSGHVWGDFGATGVGDPANGTNPAFSSIDATLYDYAPSMGVHSHSTGVANFGQKDFSGTIPAGFKRLHAHNLSEPPMIETTKAFNVALYTGDGSTSQPVSGLGLKPDLIWIKSRSISSNQLIVDSVRGNVKSLEANTDDAENNESNNGWLQSFNTDGFTLHKGDSDNVDTHHSGATYVAWCWKKQVRYGIDIQLYTGTSVAKTVAHNLGVVPELIMVKARTHSGGTTWCVYHHHTLNKTDPETDYGRLDVDNNWADQVNIWNDTAPTSSEFTVGISDAVNDDTYTYVAYLFASVPGFSKVFSYVGNGSGNGPYVYLGFRPRFLFFKMTTETTSWRLYDTERSPFNGPAIPSLYPDVSTAEGTGDGASMSFHSNGFKVRANNNFLNSNNRIVMGLAIAEQPFKYANAR